MAPARLPARPGHRRDQGRRTRRRSAASSAATASPPGATPARSAEANSLWIIDTAAALHRRALARPSRSAPVLDGYDRAAGRPSAGAKAAALAPTIRVGSPRQDRPMVGHFTDADVVLDFLARASTRGWPRWARQLPRPLPAHQGQAAGARPAGRRAASRSRSPGCASCTRRTATDYQAYYDRHADAGLAGDPRRRPADRAGARRRHVQLRQGQADRPGRRRVLRQRDQRDARRRGAVDLRARSTRRRSSGSSTGRSRRPSSQRMPKPKPLATRIALVTGAASGIGKAIAHKLAAEGACVVDRRPQPGEGPGRGRRDRRHRRRGRRPGRRQRRGRRAGRGRRDAAGVRRPRPGRQQRRPVAVQVAARDHRRPTGTCSTT